jgi:hypothetical protein
MALRVTVARLNIKTVCTGSYLHRINSSFIRMKHFNSESPITKHTKQRMSTKRVIVNGVIIGVAAGVVYSYFSGFERKLPGSIVNTSVQISVLKQLPSDLKISRKVWKYCFKFHLYIVFMCCCIYNFRLVMMTMKLLILSYFNIQLVHSAAKYEHF